MLKRAVSLIFTILLLCTMSIVAFAHDVPDMEASGSITVHLKAGEQMLDSGTLTFYRVGEIFQENGNYSFRLTEPFTDSGASLEDIHAPETAAKLASYAKQQSLSGTTVSIEQGTASLTIAQGQLGLYLLVQNQASTGWQPLNPFLITVPTMKDGKYVYQVDASPKVGNLSPVETTTPNTPKPVGPTLPQTGQLNWPVPVLVILGLGIFLIGWALRFGDKRNGHEA